MQSDFLVALLALINLVAIAGIVYPFKPFGKRSRAFLTLVASFILIGVLASKPNDGSSRNEISKQSLMERSVGATGTERPEVTNDESEPVGETGLQPVPNKEREEIIASIRSAEWAKAKLLIDRINARKFEVDSLVSDAEQAALGVVRPLPASDFAKNEEGYQFLASIVPNNLQYRKKADEYAGKRRDSEERARSAAIVKLKKKHDKVEGVTWYQHPNAPKYTNSRSTVYLYIGRRDGGAPWLRMQIQYAARDWLFVDKVEAWHDGTKETLYSGRFERDHHSTIWEWVDVSPTKSQLEILRSLGSANEAILRFHGSQYRRDVKLSSGDKRSLREILSAFEAMNQ